MCGINGIVFGKIKNSKELVSRMNSTIIHRGPDDQRVFETENCTLGHVRLSIVDLKMLVSRLFSTVKFMVLKLYEII